MTVFRPIAPPPGRLVRLGVVLDPRQTPERLGEVARMCERAGIDAVWVRDGVGGEADRPPLEAWAALTLVVRQTSRIRLGAMLGVDARPAETLASLLVALDPADRGRVELGFVGREPGRRSADYAARVRARLAGGGDFAACLLPPFSIEIRDAADISAAVEIADNAVVRAAAVADLGTFVERVRTAAADAGRAPSSLGIGVEVPVSIGRTSAEARARADAEPLFRVIGHPAACGLFGTLEECQSRVIALAHLGVTDLRCIPPQTVDLHDVIAQLTAVAVGTVETLRPDTPRSRAPDPPGWATPRGGTEP